VRCEKLRFGARAQRGNISETRKDREKVIMGGLYRNSPSLVFRFERYHRRPWPYGLLFPKIGGLHPPKILIAIISGTVKLRTSNLARTISVSIRIKAHKKFWRKGNIGVSRDCPIFRVPPIISGTGKATDFKFCQ